MRFVSKRELAELTSRRFAHIDTHHMDEMAVPSYLHGNPLIRWLMKRRYQVIASLARLSPDLSVLEFGCGSGVFLPELSANCRQVYAIDLFPEYAKLLVEKHHLRVTFPDQLADLEDGSLDLVIAADVLEHLDHPETCVDLFFSKLKPSGRLIVSGPTETIVYRLGRMLAGFGGKGDYHHTNIDALIRQIVACRFQLHQWRGLPLPIPPHLFKVCEFGKATGVALGS